jgi:hypothetical protein
MVGGKIRQLRRSQYISPFGVGAILDLGNESLIATDISNWRQGSGQVVHLKRLEYRLHVNEFRMPPVSQGFWDKNPATLPYFRFPQWLFCPSCRKLTRSKTKDEKKGEIPRCVSSKCKGSKVLVPMRFVMACEKGHLSDVPWGYWAHSKKNVAEYGRCEKHDLEFVSVAGVGGGLGSLKVRCVAPGCNSSRSLEAISAKGSMKGIGISCQAKQPWQFIHNEDKAECKHPAEVLQRGATNLYYPKTVSALDIPLGQIDQAFGNVDQEIMSHGYFQIIKERLESADDEIAMIVVEDLAKSIASDSTFSFDYQHVIDLAKGVDTISEEVGSEVSIDEREVLAEEWPILNDPPVDDDNNRVFVAKQASLDEIDNSYGLNNLIDKLVLVRRLREVRVLRGFHRVSPGDEDMLVRVDIGKKLPWLPGIEVFGEGIFISFSENEIVDWLNKHANAIGERLDVMHKRYIDKKLSFLPEPTARFVMLHTFSHLLMRQLSFECGYSASSLRERIYSEDPGEKNEPMAGILIYTADSDSEGSLGGLVRQGYPDRFVPTILTALERGTWCSSDPICRELPGQGVQGLNRAACHSCALVSETSCVSNNMLLDRMILLGANSENGRYGFFAPVLDQFTNEAAR